MGLNKSNVIDVPQRPTNVKLHDFGSESFNSYQSQDGTPGTQGSSGEEVANASDNSIRRRRKKRSSLIKAQKFLGIYTFIILIYII